MILKSVSARFDGGQVMLDENITIPPHARLLVTILEDSDADRAAFLKLSAAAFADAFQGEEVEYSEADLR